MVAKRGWRVGIWGVSIAVCLFMFWGCAGHDVYSKEGTRTTVVLIRHADRDPDVDALNAKGLRRAQALVAAVRHLPITAIYSPNLRRNIETAAPLAVFMGIDVTVSDKMGVFSVDAFVDMILSRHAGETVLCVGNASANIPALYNRLGGGGLGPMSYGDLAILTVTDSGKSTVQRSHFGE